MKKHLYSIICALAVTTSVVAQTDLNCPFGWVNCSSMTSGDDYKTTGGYAYETPSTITLTNDGEGVDMRNKVINAINSYDIIVLDGSNGDFMFSKSIDIENKKNKTIVGINGVQLYSQFKLTDAIKAKFDEVGVKSASTSSGTGGTLSNGTTVSEEGEFLTRQALIDYTGDSKEAHRKSGIFTISNCENIIIRNIKFQGPGSCDVSGYDLITATGDTHLWVDHCEFIDGMDGNFDQTNGCNFNTVSWCTFSYTSNSYNHQNTNLVGSSDSYTSDENKLNITFAFNIWGAGCNQRMPMARFGTIHLLNNYYNCPGASLCMNPRKNSEFLIDGNYSETNVKNVFKSNSGKAYVFNSNVFKSYSTPTSSGTVTVPYRYDVADATAAKEAILERSGATLTNPLDITGVSSSINAITMTPEQTSNKCYNVLGQQTNTDCKGIIIKNGRKYINK